MPEWNTRLAVSVTDSPNGPSTDITPIDSFSPSFALSAEALHSLEATHIGVVYSPAAITFSMTVKAIGDAAGKLTQLAVQGKRFDVILQRADGSGDDWSFQSIVLSECVITSAQPTAATISGAPSATFSGFSLQSTVEQRSGAKDSIGHR
jgi:hypothetical protein